MIVQMDPIQMCPDDHLVALAKQALGKGHTDGVSLLRRHLAGRKGLDEMIPHYAALFTETALCRLHLCIGGCCIAAVKRCDKLGLLCFIRIHRILNTGVQ